MAWKLMPLEEAFKLLESAPPGPAIWEPGPSRKRGDLGIAVKQPIHRPGVAGVVCGEKAMTSSTFCCDIAYSASRPA